MYKIHVDDKLFIVTLETINSYPDNLLAQVIQGKQDNCVKLATPDIYVDKNPVSFAYVISTLRGYWVNLDSITDDGLRAHVIDDLEYFGLYCTRRQPQTKAEPSEVFTKLDPSILESNDADKINELLNVFNGQLQTVPIEMINWASYDELTQEILNRQSNVTHSDSSDAGSLDLND